LVHLHRRASTTDSVNYNYTDSSGDRDTDDLPCDHHDDTDFLAIVRIKERYQLWRKMGSLWSFLQIPDTLGTDPELVDSIHVTLARRSSSRVAHFFQLKTFFCSNAKNDSMAALSAQAPTRPIEPGSPFRRSAQTNFMERNWPDCRGRC
jgi:hypothetical protein